MAAFCSLSISWVSEDCGAVDAEAIAPLIEDEQVAIGAIAVRLDDGGQTRPSLPLASPSATQERG